MSTFMDRLNSLSRVAGIKQTKNAVLGGNAKVVYAASDADPSLIAEITSLCAERGVEVVGGITRRELAKACKIDVPCAVAAALKN